MKYKAMTALVLATLAAVPLPSRAQMELTPEEEATVRIYTIQSVSLLQQFADDGTEYFVAVPEAAHGSGVVLTPDGLILTAKHVVAGVSAMSVKLPQQSRAMMAVTVYEHPTLDIAFIKVRGNFQFYVPLPEPSDAQQLRTRDDVFSVGYPLDPSESTPTTTEGTVSRMSDDGMLQLSTSLNPGNSGGPVFAEDSAGQPHLVGIAVAKPTEGEGIAWIQPIGPVAQAYERDVVPGAYVERALEQLAGDPARTRALETFSVLVAELVEAFYDPENPHILGNEEDAATFLELTDSGLPEAELLLAAFLFNEFSLAGNVEALGMCCSVLNDLQGYAPGVFYGSQFAQEVGVLCQPTPCDGANPCVEPGYICQANQCVAAACVSAADCPPPSYCAADGFCSPYFCDYATPCPSDEYVCDPNGYCQFIRPPPTTPPPGGGCASCAIGSSTRGAWLAPLLAALVALRRRRRRPSSPAGR
jgi:MYXO-CTERM domain-containing protein